MKKIMYAVICVAVYDDYDIYLGSDGGLRGIFPTIKEAEAFIEKDMEEFYEELNAHYTCEIDHEECEVDDSHHRYKWLVNDVCFNTDMPLKAWALPRKGGE